MWKNASLSIETSPEETYSGGNTRFAGDRELGPSLAISKEPEKINQAKVHVDARDLLTKRSRESWDQ